MTEWNFVDFHSSVNLQSNICSSLPAQKHIQLTFAFSSISRRRCCVPFPCVLTHSHIHNNGEGKNGHEVHVSKYATQLSSENIFKANILKRNFCFYSSFDAINFYSVSSGVEG